MARRRPYAAARCLPSRRYRGARAGQLCVAGHLGQVFVANLALVRALVGKKDEAMDLLEPLVTEPGPFSYYQVAVDPLWQSLWEEPRFRALEAKLNYQRAPSR